MPQTKFIQVATEGATSDGRTLKRADIEQMGKNYDPKKYGSRIWMEHLRGWSPNSEFKAYGDVLETMSKEVEIDGKKKLALFAKLDVTDELVEINKQRQKIYTSIEIQPNFADTGEAYLIGLGVTDSPASLGTEALKFYTSRKQQEENLFTSAIETTLEIEEQETPSASLGAELFSKVRELLCIKKKEDTEDFSGIAKAVEVVAESQKTLMEKFGDALTQITVLQAELKKAQDEAADDRKAFNDLKTALEKEPGNKFTHKPATGAGTDAVIKTDC